MRGKDVVNGFARLGNGGAVVFSQKAGERRCDLGLRDGSAMRPLAQSRCIRSDDGDPDVFGTGEALAVASPALRAVSAAVVGGVDQRRLVAVMRIRLQHLP